MKNRDLYEQCERMLYQFLLQGLPDAIFYYLDKKGWKDFDKKMYSSLREEIEDNNC